MGRRLTTLPWAIAAATIVLAAASAADGSGRGQRGGRACPPRSVPMPHFVAILSCSREGGTAGVARVRRPGRLRFALERAYMTAIFEAAARDARLPLAVLGAAGRILGFETLRARDRSAELVVVVERANARRGAGIYAVRVGRAAHEAFVQAPHRFHDEGSLAIALELFRDLGARAFGANTVHRRASDVAHDEETTFQAATLAWLAAFPRSSLVQVHGFADGRAAAEAILSAGTRESAPDWLKTTARRTSRALAGAKVAAYPDETDRFGGTSNVQGRAARAAGARFLHLELSASLRRRLGRDARARAALASALAGALRGDEDP